MCHYFRVSKIFVPHRVNSRFFVEFFVVSQCRKFPLGNPLVLYLFRVSREIMDNRGGTRRKGVSGFSVENLSHSPEKFRSGTLLCCVSESLS